MPLNDDAPERSEKLTKIFLHFDEILELTNELPRGAQLRVLARILDKLADRLQSLAPK